MFGNTIVLKSREKALVLYVLLFNDPAKGKLIKSIYVDKNFDAVWVTRAIFNTASITNLESLMGALTPDFCDLLLEINARSPRTFKKLKFLPRYQQDVDQKYTDVLLAFRETLSEIDIYNENKYMSDALIRLVPRLNTFSNLNSLKFDARFRQLSDLESVLNGCIHLKTLELGNLWDNQAMDDKADLDAWMAQNVTQVESLKQLTIRHQCRCDVLEYLGYKYRNIQNLNILLNYPGYMYAEDMPQFTTNMDRIFRAIKDITQKKLKFYLPYNENFPEIVDYFTKKDFSFNIKRKNTAGAFLVEIGGL